MNYTFEGRAYDQLRSDNSLASLSQSYNVRRQLYSIQVDTYHESYARFSPRRRNQWEAVIVVMGIILGVIVYASELVVQMWLRWFLIGVFVAIYITPTIAMHYIVYPDMGGITVTAIVYLCLFFVILETQDFNPHFDLLDQQGRLSDKKFDATRSIYDRYLIIFVGVLGFVPASFIVAASNLITTVYSREGGVDGAIYRAVHMPYFEILYTFAGFASVWLGVCVIREYHEKIKELLQFAPSSDTCAPAHE
jgi:hypothetical protein